jgi:hypothetical protein
MPSTDLGSLPSYPRSELRADASSLIQSGLLPGFLKQWRKVCYYFGRRTLHRTGQCTFPRALSVNVTKMYVFVIVVASMFSGIVLYSLHQKRDVKASIKVPFASFTFEAKDRRDAKSLQKLE